LEDCGNCRFFLSRLFPYFLSEYAMNKFYATLLAAACMLTLPAYSQTPTQTDSTKNTDVPNANAPSTQPQADQGNKKTTKKHRSAKAKKSNKHSAASSGASGTSGTSSTSSGTGGTSGNSGMSGSDTTRDTTQSPETQKKESGTPGK
jgi:hypothetical protein